MRILAFIMLVLGANVGITQEIADADKKEILAVLDSQVKCWNDGDLECYMEGYWKSDSLSFISKDNITNGWQATLERYKKRYPDKATMGKLTFGIKQVKAMSGQYCYVVGTWHIQREKDSVGGSFSLIWKRINGKWRIVADHSS